MFEGIISCSGKCLQGGNKFMVKFRGMLTNLHNVFDSGAFRLNETLSQPMTSPQASRVQEIADLAMRLYPRSSFSDNDVLFDPNAWVSMSHALAVKCLKRNKKKVEKKVGLLSFVFLPDAYLNGTLVPGSDLTEAYINDVYTVCLQMLALSGLEEQTKAKEKSFFIRLSPFRYRLQYVLQRWEMPLAPTESQPPWLLISIVSSLSALVIGVVCGAFGLWLLQKRRKRQRYLSTISHDSEDDLMIQSGDRNL